jgi:tRNA(fMet)-specific endonuclease VapC
MGRYLLDTNILVYLVLGYKDDISSNVLSIFGDYSSQLFTSSISVLELQQLYRIGKIKPKRYKSSRELVSGLEKDYNIAILPFGEFQIASLANLTVPNGHNDPFDHAIISHAISDKLILISSDSKFEKYTNQKLEFVFNKR